MKIAVLDDYQSLARQFADWDSLADRAQVDFYPEPITDADGLRNTLMPCEVVCLMRERTPFPRELIAALPNLRLIVTSGMKNASIDLQAAQDHGITVCGTPSPGHATAELAFGLILALARNLLGQSSALHQGQWQCGIGRDLHDATLGIIGLGRLGSQVAGFGLAFGMRVIAWSENLTDQRCRELDVELVTRDQLLAQSDFISLHLRLSARTRGLIDADAFARMKPDACLINTSRAPIIDESALKNALSNKQIGGIALDVFEHEPLPIEHWLRHEPRALLTPHIGYVTRETYTIFYAGTVAAIDAWLRGKPIRILKN